MKKNTAIFLLALLTYAVSVLTALELETAEQWQTPLRLFYVLSLAIGLPLSWLLIPEAKKQGCLTPFLILYLTLAGALVAALATLAFLRQMRDLALVSEGAYAMVIISGLLLLFSYMIWHGLSRKQV